MDQALVRAEASLFIVYELLKTTIYQFHAQILPKTGRRRSGVNHLPLMILVRAFVNYHYVSYTQTHDIFPRYVFT